MVDVLIVLFPWRACIALLISIVLLILLLVRTCRNRIILSLLLLRVLVVDYYPLSIVVPLPTSSLSEEGSSRW